MKPQQADVGNVQSMREFLADTLQEVDSLGERLRERVYAFELAEDPAFVEKARSLEARLSSGRTNTTAISVEDYRKVRGI